MGYCFAFGYTNRQLAMLQPGSVYWFMVSALSRTPVSRAGWIPGLPGYNVQCRPIGHCLNLKTTLPEKNYLNKKEQQPEGQ